VVVEEEGDLVRVCRCLQASGNKRTRMLSLGAGKERQSAELSPSSPLELSCWWPWQQRGRQLSVVFRSPPHYQADAEAAHGLRHFTPSISYRTVHAPCLHPKRPHQSSSLQPFICLCHVAPHQSRNASPSCWTARCHQACGRWHRVRLVRGGHDGGHRGKGRGSCHLYGSADPSYRISHAVRHW